MYTYMCGALSSFRAMLDCSEQCSEGRNGEPALVRTYLVCGDVQGNFAKHFERHDCLKPIFPTIVHTKLLYSEKCCLLLRIQR